MIAFSLLLFWFCLLNLSSAVHVIPSHFEPRVINGQDAVLGQFPWHLGVIAVFYDRAVYHQCSGALISEEWVITTAHCINGADIVAIHAETVNNFINDGIDRASKQLIVHEDFDTSTLNNDIALVQVDSPISFNENVSAIALADEELGSDVLATVTGWGHSSQDDANNSTYILQYGSVYTIENTECVKIYGSPVVQPNVVCTTDGPSGESPCFGDGGAPLVVDADSDPVLVGLLSFFASAGCGGEYPTGYARVASHRNWIREKSGV